MKEKSKTFKKTKDYMDKIEYDDGKPSGEKSVDFGVSEKALSRLPHSSYSVVADPYDAALPSSKPYPILNRFNKKIGGQYGGDKNIDGGNVQQYANSTISRMLKYFDFMRLKISSDYRYRPTRLSTLPTNIGPDPAYVGYGLVDQCRQAIAEATSVLQSTTFTQMGIYNYVVETDMAMGSAIRRALEYGDATHYVYDNLTDVLYASLTFYQIVLQEALNFFNWHNSFRMKMGTMIRSSWNRETPTLNGLFGLFKKKSWLSLMDSLALTFPGEYVDTDWSKQMNMLNMIPSRRSDAITDPVLELQTRLVHPSVFKLILVDADGNYIDTVFDLATDFVKPVSVNVDPSGYSNYFKAIDEAQDYLSAENAMQWARNNVYVVGDADTAYFNSVKYRLDVVIACMTSFKTKFNDVREVLDTVSRTGLVTWAKGFRPSVCKDTDVDLFDNQLINDIYAMTFGGAHQLIFNEATKRWRTFSLWNMYTGIPEYDAKSGGAFLSLSTKELVSQSDVDETFKYLPIMFHYDSSIVGNTRAGVVVYATNRVGHRVYIKAEAVTMAENVIFNRLVPLASQDALKLRVPVIYAYDSQMILDTEEKSTLYKTLTQVFGSAKIDNDYALEPDVLAVYQVEIEDITNTSIAYARATSPFRGSTGYADDLGFAKFGQSG